MDENKYSNAKNEDVSQASDQKCSLIEGVSAASAVVGMATMPTHKIIKMLRDFNSFYPVALACPQYTDLFHQVPAHIL
jgi:hypothetical protein